MSCHFIEWRLPKIWSYFNAMNSHHERPFSYWKSQVTCLKDSFCFGISVRFLCSSHSFSSVAAAKSVLLQNIDFEMRYFAGMRFVDTAKYHDRSLPPSLKDKGVTFEHYDIPDMTRQGDVHVGGNMKVAWFKDLDGNLLNLASR
jgi:hypothetical protein